MKKSSDYRAEARTALTGTWPEAIGAILIMSLLVSIANSFGVGFVVSGPLSVGVSYMFLHRVREGGNINLADLFRFFDSRFGTSLLAMLLVDLIVVLFAFLLVVPGIIMLYSYRLVPYLVAEREELTVTDCLRESRRLMKGNKWRAFCLDLSFIGWLLLGSLACGVGIILVMPYMQAAQAAFAADLLAVEDIPTVEEAAL